jgi:NADH:ubiquinone oxidoreductase subunit 6 (subunit J)
VTLEEILFYFFAAGGIALGITRCNAPQSNHLSDISHCEFLLPCRNLLTLHAQFIAVIQILVYAGAIMVLFVFVIMLLNLGDERRLRDGFTWKKVVAGGLGFGRINGIDLYIYNANRNTSHRNGACDKYRNSRGSRTSAFHALPVSVRSDIALANSGDCWRSHSSKEEARLVFSFSR